MARQKPWNIYESVVLLEAYLEVLNGQIDRKMAIIEVSKTLRRKAKNDGEEIDDIFRNIAGITFQMESMESAVQGRTLKKPATKLFQEVVDIKNNDSDRYNSLLKEAKQMFFTVDYRAEYQNWLVETGLQYTAARNYGNWLNNLNSFALEAGYCNVSIYEITDVEELTMLCDKLSSDEEVIAKHRDWLTSLRKFIVYKSGGEVNVCRHRTNSDLSTNSYRIEYQDWLINNGFKETAARNYGNWLTNISDYLQERGYIENSIYEIKNIDQLMSIYEIASADNVLVNNHRDYLTSFRKYIGYKSNGEIQLCRTRRDVEAVCNQPMNSSAKTEDENEIKEKYPELYMRLQSMAKVYDDEAGYSLDWIASMIGLPVEREKIKYIMSMLPWITEIESEIYSFSSKAKPMKKRLDFDKESFVKVLMMRYQNGMRFDSIDLENFRETYENVIGESIDIPDSDLESCLKQCGVVYQNRIFPFEGIISADAKERLLDYIRNTFSGGNHVLYYKSIFSDLSDTFSYCFNLTDEKMLRAYLMSSEELKEYYFFGEFMSDLEKVIVDHSSEVEEFFISAGKPLSYEEVYAGLPHISKDVIYNEIKANSKLLLNEKEHYFHYEIFELSSEEADKITQYITDAIVDDGYGIWSQIFSDIQLNMPIFIENNIYLSSIGIRNAISKKLSGRFNFDGEVISRRNEVLNMSSVYRLFGEHHAPFSDNDIYEFSREVSNGVIYFEPLSETTVRVSKDLFVRKKDIVFDIESTDNALATYLVDGYMPIKEIDSFLVFPNVGYEWNTYLLESYLMYFSEKFLLLNNGRSLNNVAGALVRKGTGYDEFVDVCADFIAKSGCTLTKDKALNCLAEENLLTRRTYSKIDEALTKARQIRNRKERS